MRPHVLVARLDNAGDVLLAGPAVRAIAASARRVTVLCGPQGYAAAQLLPGVDDFLVYDAPWVAFDPAPLDREETYAVVDELAGLDLDLALIFMALECVDAVVLFDEDTPEVVLDLLRPDVFAKGGDYSISELPEAKVLEGWGGRAVIMPYVAGRSTTRLVEEVASRGAR